MPRCSRCKKWYITAGKKSLPVMGTAVSMRTDVRNQGQLTVSAKSLSVVGTDVCNQWRVVVGKKYIAIVGGSTQKTFGWNIPSSVYSLGISNEGVAATYNLAQYASIPAGTTAVWALKNPPSGISINASGVLTKAANVAQTALLSVSVSISQSIAGYAETTRTFTLAVNGAPSWSGVPTSLSLSAGTTYNFAQHATDPESGGLTYSIQSNPGGYSIVASTGVVTIGTVSGNLVVRVTDSGGLTATATCAVTVQSQVQLPITFLPTTAEISNPERGFYYEVYGSGNGLLTNSSDSGMEADLAFNYSTGNRLVRVNTELGSGVLSQSDLNTMAANCVKIRNSGMKAVHIFKYGDDTPPVVEPSITVVEGHIAAIGSVLTTYKDTVFVIEAGFIGQWGEWHTSGSGLDTKANKRRVKTALLASMPPEIPILFTQVYPMQEDWFPTPLGAANAFNGSDISRCGFHNDSFLSGKTDAFTYPGPNTVVDFTFTKSQLEQRQYVAALSEYAPFGGETSSAGAVVDQRRACTGGTDGAGQSGGIAVEGPRYHLSFLNRGYYQPFIDAWTAGGCLPSVQRSMGYRFQLDSISGSTSVVAGQTVTVSVALRNVGWSRIFSDRRLVVSLVNGGTTYTGTSSVALRTLLSQASSSTVLSVSVVVPTSAPSGTYSIYLSIPDIYPATSAIRNFAIRFANANSGSQVWDDTLGRFATGATVSVSATQGLTWPTVTASYLPIVPDAVGYGMDTVAGSGRATSTRNVNNNATLTSLMFVTSLGTGYSGSYDSQTKIGQGTLRWCLSNYDGGPTVGPRTVIPLVSGIIDFGTSGNRVLIAGNTTYVGQAAPALGLYVKGLTWMCAGNDVLLQHANSFYPTGAYQSCFDAAHWEGEDWRRIVFANCGAFWNTDEAFSAWSLTENVNPIPQKSHDWTWWQCLVTEPRGDSTNAPPYNYGLGHGLLTHVYNYGLSFVRSALLHTYERNPRTSSPGLLFADNLIYNYGNFGTQIDGHPDATYAQVPSFTNVEANIYLTGVNTGTAGSHPAIYLDSGSGPRISGSQDYISGNVSVGNVVGGTGSYVVNSRIPSAFPAGYKTLPLVGSATDDGTLRSNVNGTVAQVKDKGLLILKNVGPYPGRRIARVTDVINTAVAKLNGSSTGLGSWTWYTLQREPTLADMGAVAATSITYAQAITTAWNNDPVPTTDRNAAQADGYTLLEKWIHRRNFEVMA